MKTIHNIFILFLFGIIITSCGGGGGESPTPDVITNITGSTWTLSEVNGSSSSDEKTTFLLQSFILNTDNAYSATFYPNTSQSGTWSEVSAIAYNLLANGATISLSNVSITDNTLSASITIPAGVGGKTAEFSGTVTYTK